MLSTGPEQGSQFGGKYQVLDLLQKGRLAAVYLAMDLELSRKVALKILPAHTAQEPDFVHRFRREGQILLELNHPHVLRCFEYGQDATTGLYYLVLEYLSGGTLKGYLDACSGPLDLEDALQVVTSVADALDFAHHRRRAVVHRDLKPSNIMFDADHQIRVTDFGIARMIAPGQPDDSDPTQLFVTAAAGPNLGTVPYMSRQRLEGSADPDVDLWALAVIAYEMIVGVLPFRGRSPEALFGQILTGNLARPRDVNPNVSAEVQQVLLKALDREPARRYQSGAEFVAALADTRRPQLRAKIVRSVSNVFERAAAPVSGIGDAVALLPGRTVDSGASAWIRSRASTMRKLRLRRGLVPLIIVLTVLVAMFLIGTNPIMLIPGFAPTPTQVPAPGVIDAPPVPTNAVGLLVATLVPTLIPTQQAVRPTLTAIVLPPLIPTATAVPTVPPSPVVPVMPAPLLDARELHSATRLQDGSALVVGGRNQNGALASVELYDAATNRWSRVGSLNVPRYRHTATLLSDGRVLVVGGQRDDLSYLASAEIFDPLKKTWSITSSLTMARAQHSATLLADGRLLIAGGVEATGFLASAELFDPGRNVWQTAAPMLDSRSGHSAVLLNDNSVLVAGGFGARDESSAERYDVTAGKWVSAGNMHDSRVRHTATRLPDGRVLVTGGTSPRGVGTYLASSEWYDPIGAEWVQATAMQEARSGHTATLMQDGSVLVAGGSSGTLVSRAERYDIGANAWTIVGALATPRSFHAALVGIDDSLVVIGGRGDAGAVDSVERYDSRARVWRASQ